MSAPSDELVSQFMSFSGCADGDRAKHYLEMGGGNLDLAVSLYMDHNPTGGASTAAAAIGSPSPDVRAPDRTRRMRLMDEVGPPAMGYTDLGSVLMGAFSDIDARAAVDAGTSRDEYGDDEMEMKDGSDQDDEKENGKDEDGDAETAAATKLSNLFAPPRHLMHVRGGFQGARSVARDSRRWLLVNLQRDSEFSSHALNRDVWRDELVENLVREGFIFWQVTDDSDEGRLYAERYKVFQFPHVAIIDPRTGRSLWKKEGWTQEKPFDAEAFAEMAMDFCSRHSFDKEPVAPATKPNGTAAKKPARPKPSPSEESQLQAVAAASAKKSEDEVVDVDDDEDEYIMEEDDDDDDDDMGEGYDDIECLGTQEDIDTAAAVAASVSAEEPKQEEEKPKSLTEILLGMEVGDEPATGGARLQLRMPDAKRLVRKFVPSDSVKTIYAFVAQNSEEAKSGRPFSLMAGYPPKSLEGAMDSTIGESGLAGQAITVRWQD